MREDVQMKSGTDRVNDAVNYIFGMGKAELATHVRTVAAMGNLNGIGNDLSLGARTDNPNQPQYAQNTIKRQALRALLLCQRVYFSDLWAQNIMMGGVVVPHNYLANMGNWKAQSVNHWQNQPTQQIEEAILSFCPTTADIGAAAVAAAGGAPHAGGFPSLTFTRNTMPFPGLTSCYGAVMTWLFQSGLVSYRWFLKNINANDQVTLEAAFGLGQTIWDGTARFMDTDELPNIPRGYVVHLYVDNPQRWNGHWLVSLGNGQGAGCNNDDTDGTNRPYTAGCSLKNQFLNGYNGTRQDGTPESGKAVMFNPLDIPARR